MSGIFRKSFLHHIILAIYSILFSAVYVLGEHIHVEMNDIGEIQVHARIDTNYIITFTNKDYVVGIILAILVYCAINIIWYIIEKVSYKYQDKISNFSLESIKNNSIDKRHFIVLFIIIVCLYIPYLLLYYPGFIFGDTIESINQAIGMNGMSNHHPVMYTMFIKVCLKLGRIIGGSNTTGCAIYCILQILFLACGEAYIITWTSFKLISNKIVRIVFGIICMLIYGGLPYFGALGIAMWKDPIFSMLLAILSIRIFDIICCDDEKGLVRKSVIIGILALATVFMRNNGIYIIFLLLVCVLLCYIIKRFRDNAMKYMVRSLIVITCIYIGITKFVYPILHIGNDVIESYGIFVNQMARVVVYEGNLDEKDKKYLNKLLPYEKYSECYAPCLIDDIKWSGYFNPKPLKKKFFKHWFKIGIKNPRLYIESWIMETYGFWVFNCDELLYHDSNIMMGVPQNVFPGFEENLKTRNISSEILLGNENLKNIFNVRSKTIPIGMITWILLLLICVLIIKKEYRVMLVLVPSIGLMITLIVASPICYWPRYALAIQYLLPLYIGMYRIK